MIPVISAGLTRPPCLPKQVLSHNSTSYHQQDNNCYDDCFKTEYDLSITESEMGFERLAEFLVESNMDPEDYDIP